MNEIQVTIRGNVTSEPRQVRFDDGNIVTSFRVASNARRFDTHTREWVNTGTTFVNVNCRRGMASNAADSLRKGQPVLVTGKLRERSWEKDGKAGRSLEIEADGLGHDLAWGTSQFDRVVRFEQIVGPRDRPDAAALHDHGSPGGHLGDVPGGLADDALDSDLGDDLVEDGLPAEPGGDPLDADADADADELMGRRLSATA